METSYKRRRFLYHFGQAAVAAPGLSLLSLDAAASNVFSSPFEEEDKNSQDKKVGNSIGRVR